jgi:TolB-like protein
MRSAVLAFAFSVLIATALAGGAEGQQVRVELKDGTMVEGTVVETGTEAIKVKVAAGDVKTLPNDSVKKITPLTATKPGSEKVAATFVKDAMPALSRKTEGKIIKVSDGRVYGNLGTQDAVAVGMILTVSQKGESLVDPDTGEALGTETKLVGRVKVLEVGDKYFKAANASDTEPTYAKGQSVEPEGASNAVAVFPFVVEGKGVRYTALSDLILGELVKAKVKVVEREMLAALLVEQGISDSYLADPSTAQKIGKLTGAGVIVTGVARESNKGNSIQIRVIDVSTGKVLLANTYELGEPIKVGEEKKESGGAGDQISKDLIAHYPLGGHAKDTSGGGHHGEVHGVVPTADRHGVENGAFLFNGKDNYIVIKDKADQFLPRNDMTVCLWAKLAGPGGGNGEDQDLFVSNNRYTTFTFRRVGNQLYFRIIPENDSTSGQAIIQTNKNYNDDRWHHLTIAKTGKTMLVYVDGEQVGKSHLGQDLLEYRAENPYVGTFLPGLQPFNGALDEIRVYGRCLSVEEVAELAKQ